MNNFIFLVKADLLLHEKTYDKLKDFVKDIDVSFLNPHVYYVIDCLAEDDENSLINFYIDDSSLWSKTEKLIDKKIKNGFILINFTTLKSMLSLA